jgi:hypothetical protein
MLRNSFCHIPGIGLKSERDLWGKGVLDWNDVFKNGKVSPPRIGYQALCNYVKRSLHHLERGDAAYFSRALPRSETWRLFHEFKHSIAYLDIETTGLGNGLDHITTIAMYDGRKISHYVYGRNLEDFVEDLAQYDVLVTYNGLCFDIPFIERFFGIKLRHAQIDLRFILKSLGYTGGLKGCEKSVGLDRKELKGVDGYFAVLLWRDFESKKNEKALETLIAYNVLDAVNLETLMTIAYNEKLIETPFDISHRAPMPRTPKNPFKPDKETIEEIVSERYGAI